MAVRQADTYLSDLSVCTPAEALSREPRQGCWHLVDYETDDGLSGVMVYARPEENAPEITLALPDGHFKIFLGVNYAKSELGDHIHQVLWSAYGNTEVKLSSDSGFCRVAAEQPWSVNAEPELHKTKFPDGKRRFRTIQETYWKTVRLDGSSLVVRPPVYPFNGAELGGVANLSYVRLVPLTDDEIAELDTWRPDTGTRRVAQVYCAGLLSGHIQGTFEHHADSVDWFRNEIAPSAGSDVDMVIFEAIRGNYCCYRSRIGDVGADGNRWDDRWTDPLAAFVQAAHEQDVKLFASMRMVGGVYPTIRTPIGRARHFWDHPQWAKRDRTGRPTTSLSLAFPEVRAHWLSLLRETLEYGVDGVVVYFHRFHPFVAYEQPVVESFQREYGQDPYALPPGDPLWIRHAAGYVTQFVREVRQLVDEYPGRKLGVTFYGGPTKHDPQRDYDPIRYSCDVFGWMRESLADYYFPMSSTSLDLVRRMREQAGPDVHIWPDLMPRTQPGEEFVRLAREYYAAGADGFCLNDGERRAPRISEWAVQRSLGHREMLDKLEADAENYYRVVGISYLMGFNTRFSFNNFGGDP